MVRDSHGDSHEYSTATELKRSRKTERQNSRQKAAVDIGLSVMVMSLPMTSVLASESPLEAF